MAKVGRKQKGNRVETALSKFREGKTTNEHAIIGRRVQQKTLEKGQRVQTVGKGEQQNLHGFCGQSGQPQNIIDETLLGSGTF